MIELNKIYCGDCVEVMSEFPDNSIDMVFVDPPYGKDGIYLYKVVAKEAARILKSGKFAVFYASDYWLDKTFPKMLNYLDYFYLFHHINDGGAASIFPRKIFAGGKSLLVFSKGKAKPINWVYNKVPQHKKEKSHRKDNWEQTVFEASYFIDAFSKEGDVILDPNMGSGTTCVAAKELNRNYIGIEISSEQCAVAQDRLKKG